MCRMTLIPFLKFLHYHFEADLHFYGYDNKAQYKSLMKDVNGGKAFLENTCVEKLTVKQCWAELLKQIGDDTIESFRNFMRPDGTIIAPKEGMWDHRRL